MTIDNNQVFQDIMRRNMLTNLKAQYMAEHKETLDRMFRKIFIEQLKKGKHAPYAQFIADLEIGKYVRKEMKL